MQVISGLTQITPFRGGMVSIGNFDGVHCGHRAMLQTLVERARARHVPAIAMTFDPPPVALIAPERVPPRLSTVFRKAELMAQLGIDCLLVYPTHHEFLNLTAEEFFQQIVREQLQAVGLVEGANFCFGKNRQGNSQLLRTYCDAHQLELQIIPPIMQGGQVISSSRIRQLILEGQLEEANLLLGQPYRVTGTVISGAQRGRLLGFPTANLGEIQTLLPRAGVYAGLAQVGDQSIPAAINIGPNPTFADLAQKFEVFLIGYQGDLYGQSLSVDLLAHCRDVRQFDSGEALRLQLEQDVHTIQQLVAARLNPLS